MGSRILSLRKPWVGHYYHTTHTTHARGFSILIHKSLPFILMDLNLDPEGKYVMLHATVDSMPLVLVGLYNPPPATIGLLNRIAQIVVTY